MERIAMDALEVLRIVARGAATVAAPRPDDTIHIDGDLAQVGVLGIAYPSRTPFRPMNAR
jgi:hypothetical protein